MNEGPFLLYRKCLTPGALVENALHTDRGGISPVKQVYVLGVPTPVTQRILYFPSPQQVGLG